jgi:hypothetical protein
MEGSVKRTHNAIFAVVQSAAFTAPVSAGAEETREEKVVEGEKTNVTRSFNNMSNGLFVVPHTKPTNKPNKRHKESRRFHPRMRCGTGTQ